MSHRRSMVKFRRPRSTRGYAGRSKLDIIGGPKRMRLREDGFAVASPECRVAAFLTLGMVVHRLDLRRSMASRLWFAFAGRSALVHAVFARGWLYRP